MEPRFLRLFGLEDNAALLTLELANEISEALHHLRRPRKANAPRRYLLAWEYALPSSSGEIGPSSPGLLRIVPGESFGLIASPDTSTLIEAVRDILPEMSARGAILRELSRAIQSRANSGLPFDPFGFIVEFSAAAYLAMGGTDPSQNPFIIDWATAESLGFVRLP